DGGQQEGEDAGREPASCHRLQPEPRAMTEYRPDAAERADPGGENHRAGERARDDHVPRLGKHPQGHDGPADKQRPEPSLVPAIAPHARTIAEIDRASAAKRPRGLLLGVAQCRGRAGSHVAVSTVSRPKWSEMNVPSASNGCMPVSSIE